MNERFDIQYGQAFTANLQDDDGAVDLTGADVVLQRRVDCGTISEIAATITSASTGGVSATGVPLGHFDIRWKVSISGVDTYYPDYGWDELVVRSVDECATFELFVSNITQTVFPEGEAENLVRNHRQYIGDALIDLQQKVPCLRVQHRERISQVDTFLECGASVVQAPRGFISSIYAVTQDSCCARRYFTPIDQDEMLQVLKDNQNCGTYLEPGQYYVYDGIYVGYPDYGCLDYADSTGYTDAARRPSSQNSVVSMDKGVLRLFPWLQSNEILVIEWDGIKRAWKDTDEVTWDREIQDAVEHYLDFKSQYREDCDAQRMQVARGLYDESVARQIWQCRNERRIDRRRHYFSNCGDFCNAAFRNTGASTATTVVIDQLTEPEVNNYTELREIADPRLYTSVKVLGYATAFDGGGGIFIRRENSPPQTDNDGDTIESALSLAWFWRKWL